MIIDTMEANADHALATQNEGRIADGVFFTVPPTLPRGRHELSREDVLAAHRERMMIAATELLASEGVASVGVREICARAAASRAAFYECFADKFECIFAAYDRFIHVIETRLGAARTSSSEWEPYVDVLIEEYLTTLQLDLVTARAFQVEMDSFGREARHRRRESLARMAMLIKNRYESSTGHAQGPLSQYVGAVYAVRQTASDALDAEAHPDLVALTKELAPWVGRIISTPVPRSVEARLDA